ncbi:MAG: alternative ribosome rescue aminoacyl-tRNA hydrolase ArfB [Solirubrobacteraceae bacterium]
MPEELFVTPSLSIPLSEITLRTSRSSGPGGQHANKSASRVEAILDLRASTALSESQRQRALELLGPRLTVIAQDERSQARNRELALGRLAERLRAALVLPSQRHPTKPSVASRERRLSSKRHTAQRKRQRREPPPDQD